ncbi:MAG: flagellar hook-length control protein FliK [Duganella sp.]
MTMNISNAGAAALALPGAPIAASRVSDDGARPRRADTSATDNRNTDSRSNGINVNAAGKTPVQLRNANSSNSNSATNTSTSGAASREKAGATNQQNATGATNPRFAQLLGQAVEDDADTSVDAGSTANTVPAADIAAAAHAPPAQPPLAAAVLAAPAPVVAAVPAPLEADGNSAARQDSTEAVSAVSTLSVAPTRLNLAAAGVAVHAITDTGASAQPGNPVSSQLTALATPADSENNKQAQAAATVATAAVAVTINPAPAHAVLAQQAGVASSSKADTAQIQAAPTATPVAAPAVAPTPVPAAPVSERVAARPLPESTAGVDAARTAAATPASSATTTGSKEDSRANASLNGSATVAQPALAAAPAAGNGNASAVVKLAGTPEQWQQPLREALGDRLQLNLQRNNDHALIRLEPPNMGSIEISIRHSAGALQVNLSANNSEVLRQLNTIGDSVRQDLSNRQFSEVAVTVSSARSQAQSQGQAQADGGRQQREQDQQRTPGRALSEDDTLSTFAMNHQE